MTGEITPALQWKLAPTTSAPHSPVACVQRTVEMGTLEPVAVTLARRWLNPLTAVLTLVACSIYYRISFAPEYIALALVAFLLSAHLISPALDTTGNQASTRYLRTLCEWGCVAASLLMLGILLNLEHVFSREVMLAWLLATPVALPVVNRLYVSYVAKMRAQTAPSSCHIIIGVNDVGVELTARLQQGTRPSKFLGYFDHRSSERLPDGVRHHLVGDCKGVAEFVRRHAVDAVYIALPMSTSPRIAELLNDLRDTTASVYFVPSLFAFDLVQARCIDVNGMPVLAVCDTPLHGIKALRKRIVDIALSLLAISILWPVLLAIAVAVRRSSSGPILFKQKRYGLNGEEIVVYKFRTMKVCEDGPIVLQAKKHDDRITTIGRFLRRSSLDELPQIFNVLQGTMSFVGPRPHAVAHNEQYRKLINGYMIRHKVRPGITGWAQINGHRGETDTIDKMQQRVRHDIDYIKNWSLWFDFKIIAKTALSIVGDRNAY
jgi:putative colanic acid biosynthesis UDP-glucose lipid carrier transferase